MLKMFSASYLTVPNIDFSRVQRKTYDLSSQLVSWALIIEVMLAICCTLEIFLHIYFSMRFCLPLIWPPTSMHLLFCPNYLFKNEMKKL